jgi:serine/threonine protein phosphatase PrpC
MSVEVRGRQRLGGLLSRLSESRSCRVAAASRPGLLRRLRGDPDVTSKDRHAVVLRPDLDYIMVAAFAGHGEHGAEVAELAADVIADVLDRRILSGAAAVDAVDRRDSGGSSGSSSGSGGGHGDGAGPGDAVFDVSVELAMQDAFVEASMAVDATVWARASGTTATVCVLRGGVLVVGNVGDGAVCLARRHRGVVSLQRLGDAHSVAACKDERERVERFGGIIHGAFVTDDSERRALGVTRTLGDVDLRRAGVCQLPQIGSIPVTHRDSYVMLCTSPLWDGPNTAAPPALSHVLNASNSRKDDGPFDVSRQLLDVAFGAAGPAADATLVCLQLRR